MTSKVQDLSGLAPGELEGICSASRTTCLSRTGTFFLGASSWRGAVCGHRLIWPRSFGPCLKRVACISRFTDPLVEQSPDGAVKYGFTLEDGHLIESVYIPEEASFQPVRVHARQAVAHGALPAFIAFTGAVWGLSAAHHCTTARDRSTKVPAR